MRIQKESGQRPRKAQKYLGQHLRSEAAGLLPGSGPVAVEASWSPTVCFPPSYCWMDSSISTKHEKQQKMFSLLQQQISKTKGNKDPKTCAKSMLVHVHKGDADDSRACCFDFRYHINERINHSESLRA